VRQIARMTTTYDMLQDRLRVSVLDSDGRTALLWLTQRLAGRVIAALIEQLDQAAAPGPAAGPVMAAPRAVRSGMQLLEQARADLERVSKTAPEAAAPAVVALSSDEQFLVHKASVRRGDRGVILAFHWSEAVQDAAILVISATRLRQWLRIFHNHYRNAGWPLDIWPKWFEDAARPTGPGRTCLH